MLKLIYDRHHKQEARGMDIDKNDNSSHIPQPAEILSVMDINIDKIRLNPYQPRKAFDDQKLEELAESIRQNGILQPVVVRPVENGAFELVAGERRFRAAVLAGLGSIPAVARQITDKESLELALIENLQREDIKPLECAQAYRRLMDEFGLTQEQVAERVGKSRPAVANTLRLLNLPIQILESLEQEQITEGHARALLSISDPEEQLSVWKKVVKNGLSVRETERLSRMSATSRSSRRVKVSRETRRHGQLDPHLADVEDKLRRFLGTKVTISCNHEKKGSIEIEFYGEDDLMRIIDLISHA
ncbi:MAG: ParB/RepB/Spo0J family partition protein [Armatimonadota bacterium]|nr:ParB/RepB/Spo0J family partition protein [Armatimonadota bacterium]